MKLVKLPGKNTRAWLRVLLTAFFALAAARNGGAAVQPRTFPKEVYPLEDTILTGAEPNVLFFLDTSSSMTMSMVGELPTFNTDDSIMKGSMPLMRDGRYRAGLLKNATYGSGARPLSFGAQSVADRLANGGIPDLGYEGRGYANESSYASHLLGYTRWGVDRDRSNNVIGDLNCYYSPDPARPFLLTFKDYNWANWNGAGNPPKAVGDGLGAADSHTKASITMPAALRACIGSGKPVPDNLTQYLVPNDSKMYQMKLALWRLLEPGADRDNARVLSRMRLGVAGNFFDYFYGQKIKGAMYRRPPFMSFGAKSAEGDGGTYMGGSTNDFRAWHNGDKNAVVSFPYGTAPEAYSGIPGGDYGHTELLYSAVLSSYESDGSTGGKAQRHARRAYLRVPFDFMYTFNRQTGAYNPTQSLVAIKELIDGVEQYDRGTGVAAPMRMSNEELVAGGLTRLSASFYGRNGLHSVNRHTGNQEVLNGRRAIDYATGGLDHRELWSGISGTGTGILTKRVKNSEGLMSGTAMGSVIDFFSPFKDAPEGDGIATGPKGLPFTEFSAGGKYNEENDTRGYFQVTGSCQQNWLVVFTGGNEIPIPGQDPVQSLLQLHKNSKTMRGRHWNGTKWVERTYEMDSPIRTIFVGMVSPAPLNEPDGNPYAPDAPNDSSAKRLRKAITRMAHAGQPNHDGTPDATVEPFFVDNAADLINALQSILLQIRTEQFASGAPVIQPLYEGSSEKALFGASYEINMFRQWGATFRKYMVSPDASVVSTPDWAAEKWMKDNAASRRVFVTTGREGEAAGLNSVKVTDLPLDIFASLTGVSQQAGEFRDWLVSYQGETGVLGDMEHSGLSIVGKPALDEIPPRDTKIYIQTNRGVLHSIDFHDGKEDWAFIPPNVFQNKIKHLKYSPYTGLWEGGDGVVTVRSRPLSLLDGMLSASDVKIGEEGRTYLLGNLGWGGNGFYAMDVTSPESVPKFLWAVENARYATPPGVEGVKLWGGAASLNEHDYSDLGLTIAAAEVRVTPTRPEGVGILPGGLGYQGGGDSQGRAFYIFNPENAAIIKKISDGNGFEAPTGQGMGMGVTPVTYLKGGVGFFTADSEGNVISCDMSGDPADWRMRSIFQLRTVDGSKPVAITKALLLAVKGNRHWLFGGTSDLMLPDPDSLVSADRKLVNPEQFIFALNRDANPTMIGGSPVPLATSQLVALKYMKDGLYPPNPEAAGGEQVTVQSDAYGWYLKLRGKVSHGTDPTDPEYVTTAPFLYQGVLYVSTFVPRTRQPYDNEKCPELGDGKLYALDPLTGKSMWQGGQQALVFENIKISGISASMGKLFLGVKVLKGGALNQLKHISELGEFQIYAEGQYIAFDALGEPPTLKPDVQYNVPHLQYWKERF